MKTQQKTAEVLHITELDGLDPVTCYFVDDGPGCGRLTVVCYTGAWTYYWGAMGGMPIKQFVGECSQGYLFTKLVGSWGKRTTKKDDAYLARICDAVQEAIRQDLNTDDLPAERQRPPMTMPHYDGELPKDLG